MEVRRTDLDGVVVIATRVWGDERGYFRETWHRERYRDSGIPDEFVQDNVSRSSRGVLRGLHYQHPGGQGKLVSVLAGSVFDVAVDIRLGSPTFGRWIGVELSASNGLQLFIPAGFAHGFLTTSETTVLAYKCTSPYQRENEGCILWNDDRIGIEWPMASPILSTKDAAAPLLEAVDRDRLPPFGTKEGICSALP